jgi:hypothetical protein
MSRDCAEKDAGENANAMPMENSPINARTSEKKKSSAGCRVTVGTSGILLMPLLSEPWESQWLTADKGRRLGMKGVTSRCRSWDGPSWVESAQSKEGPGRMVTRSSVNVS